MNFTLSNQSPHICCCQANGAALSLSQGCWTCSVKHANHSPAPPLPAFCKLSTSRASFAEPARMAAGLYLHLHLCRLSIVIAGSAKEDPACAELAKGCLLIFVMHIESMVIVHILCYAMLSCLEIAQLIQFHGAVSAASLSHEFGVVRLHGASAQMATSVPWGCWLTSHILL